MSEQAILPLSNGTSMHTDALDMARISHQKYIVKQQKEDLEKAIEYYIEAIRNNSSVAEPYYRLASLLYKKGQITIESAIEQCKTAASLEPDNTNAHIYAGYFFAISGDYKSAQKEFKHALKSNLLKSARPRIFLSKLIKKEMAKEGITIGRLAKYLYYLLSGGALISFDSAVIKMALETLSDNLNVFSYRALGKVCELVKLYSAAYNTYSTGMMNTEHGEIFYKKMGDLSMHTKDILSGYKCYKEALKGSPDNREILLKLATLIQAAIPERLDEAIDYYNKLLEFNIDNDKIYYELGHIYLRKDDRLNAVSAFKLALGYNENNPYVNNSLAYAYVRFEMFDDAISYYQKAIQLNPDAKWTSIVCHALGAVYAEVKGNYDAAEATYQAGLVLDSKNYELMLALGDLHMIRGNVDKAIKTYCDAISIDPDNYLAYSKAGLALWEKDYIDESIVSFHKSIQLNPDFEIAQNNLGVVYLDGLGEAEEALKYFIGAIKLNPNYTLAYFNAGRAYQLLDETTKSAEYLQMALDLNQITHELNDDDINTRLYELFN